MKKKANFRKIISHRLVILTRSKMAYWDDLNTCTDPADRADARDFYTETCAKIEELRFILSQAAAV